MDAPALCLIISFHAGSRRRQQQHRLVPAAACSGDVPRMIARRRLGGIGALLLLVDDDQPDLTKRRKYRGPRADHHISQSLSDALVFVGALRHRQSAVQHRYLLSKPPRKQLHRLRRQRDLRHQNDDALALGAHLLDQLQVDLTLSRAGHAVQQRRKRSAFALFLPQLPQLFEGFVLRGIQHNLFWRRHRPIHIGTSEDLPSVIADQPSLLHLVDGLSGGAGVVAQLLERNGRRLPQQLNDFLALCSQTDAVLLHLLYLFLVQADDNLLAVGAFFSNILHQQDRFALDQLPKFRVLSAQ